MKKITLLEYSKLSKERQAPYDFAVKSTEGRNFIEMLNCGNWLKLKPKHKEIWDFNWADIIELKAAAKDESVENIAKTVYGVFELQKVNVIDVFTSFKWVLNGVAEILRMEKQELSSELSEKDKAAGVEDLQRFGEQPLILSVMKMLRMGESEVLALPYHKVFMLLCYQKTVADINQKRYENVSR